MVAVLFKIGISLLLGILAGCAAIYIFNKMPAAWLCDYGEKPSHLLQDPYVPRIKGFPWRWVYAAGFACLLIRLSFFDVQFAAAGLFACWALLIIGLADLKYMIIPDQFVIMLAISAFGFVPYHQSVWQPVLGALIGGGVMLLVAALGAAAFGREVMGFGDVKLFASIGLALGIKGVLIVLIGSSIFSGLAAAIGLASGRYKKDDVKPLGPYICAWGALYIFILFPLMP